MSPAWLLVVITATYTVWQIFSDGPQAFYVSCGVLVAVLLLEIGRLRGGDWWPVCWYGAALGATQAACGSLFAGDGSTFICDSGTGVPISLMTFTAGGFVALELLRRHRKKGARDGGR